MGVGRAGPDPVEFRRVRVELGPRSYEVVIGTGAVSELAGAGRAFLVFDGALPAGLVDRARGALGTGLAGEIAIAATEGEKSLGTLEGILSALAGGRLERGDALVSLGGGIVTDVGGFAAATYRRGIAHIACPTTLLAMVDASVGGKTGVNLRVRGGGLLKNMAGAFHQPRRVLADTGALASLPAREVACGMAECIKHAMIGAEAGDADLLGWMETRIGGKGAGTAGEMVELIARNVGVKAAIVAGDEREERDEGGRALLNLGHTFGHAMETIPGARGRGLPAPMLHGEAVALGLIAACRVGVELGLVGVDYAARVGRLVERAGLPVAAEGLPRAEDVVERMGSDKKVRGGKLRLVVPTGAGRARLVEEPARGAVLAALRAVGAA